MREVVSTPANVCDRSEVMWVELELRLVREGHNEGHTQTAGHHRNTS